MISLRFCDIYQSLPQLSINHLVLSLFSDLEYFYFIFIAAISNIQNIS